MLTIRMQRAGRCGHAQFRVIVQDSRFSPTRGRVVSYLGSYNPHTKAAKIDAVMAARYLENGAQPSDTVARLLKKQGIKLPAWVKLSAPQKRTVRNPEKRRSTAAAKPEAATTGTAAEPPAATATPAAPAQNVMPADQPAEETAPPQPAGAEAQPAKDAAETPAQPPETATGQSAE